MISALNLISFFVVSFLIGAVPIGYLIGRLRGVDIRSHGSGNIGATNAARVLGKKAGIITLILDIAKGALAVSLSYLPMFQKSTHFLTAQEIGAIFGLLAISGHCFSPFLRFQGGKGVATALGVFLSIAPVVAGLGLTSFVVVFLLSGYVSLSSIIAAIVMPTLIFFDVGAKYPFVVFLAMVLTSLLVIWRHQSNIARLISGTESRMKTPVSPQAKE